MITDCEPPPRVEFRHFPHKSLVEFKHFPHKSLVEFKHFPHKLLVSAMLVAFGSVLQTEAIVGLMPRVVYSSAEFEEEYSRWVLSVVLLMPVASPLPISSVLLLVGIAAVLVGATLTASSSHFVGDVCL